MRIALAQINPIIGSLSYNRDKIIQAIEKARLDQAEIVVFSEMVLCGYPPQDLLLLPSFVEAVEEELQKIIKASKELIVIVGTIRKNSLGEKKLYNSAAIIEDGRLIGFQDKMLLPDYDVFSERRYFDSAAQIGLWEIGGIKIAVTICEDIWHHSGAVLYTNYSCDPIVEFTPLKPDLLINLSASPYSLSQHLTRLQVCQSVALTLQCPLLYCNQVGGNDSLIFDGYSLYMNKEGEVIQEAKGFEEDILLVNLEKKNAPDEIPTPILIENLYKALVLGVRDYFFKQGFSKACFGLSGGIDSAVVACIAEEALGKENVLALALPSRYSSKGSLKDAKKLTGKLGITLKEISIEKPFGSFLEDLNPYFKGLKEDTTEENIQARIRGMFLMAFANKFGYIVLGTGNKSETAMGYTTLYGDMCGGLGVLSDVTKGQVYALADWINRNQEVIPTEIILKPPSAELRFEQKDSDTLPAYPIIDLVLEEYVERHFSPELIAERHHLSPELVKGLVYKIHSSEYKRQQAPPGLRVTSKAFTVGRRFPIAQHWNMLT